VSEDGRVSCGSCHPRERAFVDGNDRTEIEGRPRTPTNTTTLLNVRYYYWLGWFGQSDSLEGHLDGLIKSRKLMASSWDGITGRLQADPKWVRRFSAVFSDGVTSDNVRRALLAYERSLTTPNAPFDRFLRGEAEALSSEARQGYSLFKSFGCVSCHQGVAVGANMLETFGVMRDYFADRGERSDADRGRMNVTGRDEDRHVFRVPSLRNVAVTAPYFHDGSAPTLDEAVKVMARYQLGRELDPNEIGAIVAFLGSLTGEYPGDSR
ncbi:MAG TPA: cytochrome c peroxidase, partial [Polyangiaceae bacterium]|nr:cytochrome c peroxidase [Polyangiaceae bacterium]